MALNTAAKIKVASLTAEEWSICMTGEVSLFACWSFIYSKASLRFTSESHFELNVKISLIYSIWEDWVAWKYYSIRMSAASSSLFVELLRPSDWVTLVLNCRRGPAWPNLPILKLARVAPILKESQCNRPSSYLAVAILSMPWKRIQNLLCNGLLDYSLSKD